MQKIPRYDSADTFSWVRSEKSSPPALKKWRLDLITARGWCTLGAGAFMLLVAHLFGRHELMAIAISLLVLTVISWVLASTLRGHTQIHRELVSAEPSVGDVARIRITADDTAVIQEQLPESFGRGPMLNAPGTCEYELVFNTRGIHNLGPAQRIVTDSLGLIRGMANAGQTLEVPVRSQIIDLRRFANLGEQVISGEARQSQSKMADYYDVAIRDYQQGDSIRQVHWKASARQGKLMVRQENHVATAHAHFILDTHAERWCRNGVDLRLMIPNGSGEPLVSSRRFETALSLLSSIGLRLAGSGYSLSFLDLSGSPISGTTHRSAPASTAGSSFDSFHAATSSLALAPSVVSSPEDELLGARLFQDLLEARDEPVFMVLGEITLAQAHALVPLARSVRRMELFVLVAHPERYAPVEQELARAGWQIHILAANNDIEQIWEA